MPIKITPPPKIAVTLPADEQERAAVIVRILMDSAENARRDINRMLAKLSDQATGRLAEMAESMNQSPGDYMGRQIEAINCAYLSCRTGSPSVRDAETKQDKALIALSDRLNVMAELIGEKATQLMLQHITYHLDSELEKITGSTPGR